MTRTSRATSAQSISTEPISTEPISTLKHARTYEVALSKRGFGPVAGVDEAGRGACAGPIVIAASCLPEKPIAELAELTDSKKLSPRARERLFPLVQRFATSYSVIVIPAAEVDECGIQHANISGMRRAVATLEERPGYVLTDAMKVPGLRCPYLPIIGGDAACRCIAAASVLAKVTRDHIMVDLSKHYPEYGFEGHKGYGTAIHMDAIRRHGASAEHRMTYSNVRQAQAVFLTQSGAQPG